MHSYVVQTAELSKALTTEKENEAKLLSRSVEELESTVYALESQVSSVSSSLYLSVRFT
jgi:hypothetical protein